jgi:hypothetical protein
MTQCAERRRMLWFAPSSTKPLGCHGCSKEANIMKAFSLVLLLWLPLTLSAQNASPAGAADLLIIDYKLGPFVRIDVSSPDPPQGTPPDPLLSTMTDRFGKEGLYVYQTRIERVYEDSPFDVSSDCGFS